MKKFKLKVIIWLLLIIPINVSATSGCCSHHGGVDCTRVQSNGKVICNDGNTSSSCDYSSMAKCKGYNPNSNTNNKNNSNSSTTNNSNSNSNPKKETIPKKSNIAVLSSLKINDSNIEIKDNMKYSTYNNDIGITYKVKDSKSTVKINKPSYLKEGINNIEIIVTAEDGTTKKTYNLEVTRLVRETTKETNTNSNINNKPSSNSNTTTESFSEKEENNLEGVGALVTGILIVLGGSCVYNKVKNNKKVNN